MKYSHHLECVADAIALIPTEKAQTLANALYTCNNSERDTLEKLIAIGRILI
ncbi:MULTISPECIES: hypothetical protein [unclassified Acinetobacter]|uniref:hypothetical protein n=1 Tax=unclassified Acinetobacter TaxID=196816 RepID=UPI0012F82F88|nr:MULTISPECIES: hypothetical protein [unclassified Acinetobacter]